MKKDHAGHSTVTNEASGHERAAYQVELRGIIKRFGETVANDSPAARCGHSWWGCCVSAFGSTKPLPLY